MLEPSNKYRAKFTKKGQQEKWLRSLPFAVDEIANLCQYSERTIRDWRRERFLMDYESLVKICKKCQLSIPEVKKLPRYSHTQKAGRKGASVLLSKYGRVPIDETVRKEKWKEWWNSTGKFKRSPRFTAKNILLPKENEKLAEFMGIMLGDGTVAPYHIAVTLHSEDDKEYSLFVASLIEELFGTKSKVYSKKGSRAISIVVARKQLVDFLVGKGLPKGNKLRKDLSIPKWIFNNELYVKACLRGLMDTDGSVFTHNYISRNKKYSYKKLSFTSASPSLCQDFQKALQRFDIVANCSGRNVRIESNKGVRDYALHIGSHNPKHLKRLIK